MVSEAQAAAHWPEVVLRFDRGTVLVDHDRARACSSGAEDGRRLLQLGHGLRRLAVPELMYDERVGLYRAPAFRYRILADALAAHGVSVRDELACAARLRHGVSGPALRSYQQDALLAWELGHRRGIVVLPTGAGKTRLAMAALEVAASPTLVLVPTRVLCEQWRTALEGAELARVGQVGDGRHDIAPVTVATFESALRHMERMGRYFGMLVVDEVHHFSSGARLEALEMCPAPYRLGLTATLSDSASETQAIARVVGPVVCRRSLLELSGSHLAPFDLQGLQVELNVAERRVYDRDYRRFLAFHRELRSTGRQGSWAQFVRMASQSQAGRQALAGFHAARALVAVAERKLEATGRLLARHRHERVLVFCASNRAAYEISRRYLIPAITADIGRKERSYILDAFRSGQLRALVSSRVLNEGVDVPEVGVGIIVGGVMGVREHVQRVGRLLRPAPGKRAVVYELVVLDTFEARHAQTRRRGLAA